VLPLKDVHASLHSLMAAVDFNYPYNYFFVRKKLFKYNVTVDVPKARGTACCLSPEDSKANRLSKSEVPSLVWPFYSVKGNYYF